VNLGFIPVWLDFSLLIIDSWPFLTNEAADFETVNAIFGSTLDAVVDDAGRFSGNEYRRRASSWITSVDPIA